MSEEQIIKMQEKCNEAAKVNMHQGEMAIAIALLEIAQQLRVRNELEAKRFSP